MSRFTDLFVPQAATKSTPEPVVEHKVAPKKVKKTSTK